MLTEFTTQSRCHGPHVVDIYLCGEFTVDNVELWWILMPLAQEVLRSSRSALADLSSQTFEEAIERLKEELSPQDYLSRTRELIRQFLLGVQVGFRG